MFPVPLSVIPTKRGGEHSWYHSPPSCYLLPVILVPAIGVVEKVLVNVHVISVKIVFKLWIGTIFRTDIIQGGVYIYIYI